MTEDEMWPGKAMAGGGGPTQDLAAWASFSLSWTDTRNSLPGGKEQDIFARTVTISPLRSPAGGILAAAILIAGGCRSGDAPLPKGPAQVTVTMSEYRFDLKPLPDRRAISFRVVNSGSVDHDLTLIRIPDAARTSLVEQLRGRSRYYVVPIVEVNARRPGEEGLFAADLTPGRYGIVCFVRDPDGVPHSLKGMSAEFKVT